MGTKPCLLVAPRVRTWSPSFHTFLRTACSAARASTAALQIFDAKTMAAEPLAKVELPVRVPLGFHGLVVRQSEVDQQGGCVAAVCE